MPIKNEPTIPMSKEILPKNIRRGKVYWAHLDDAEGYEQKGPRPVVIVSNNQQNEIGNLLVVVPLSRSIGKIYPFQVPTFFQGEYGKAKCEQVRAITSDRLEKYLGELTHEEMKKINQRLLLILALKNFSS